MKKIRQSVFETSSSSSHSLVFSQRFRGHDYNLPVDENGVLTIPFGEFGWGPDILKTPMDKLSYYVTDHSHWGYDDDRKSKKAILKEIQENKEIQKVVELIKNKCPQVKKVRFQLLEDTCYPRGYVDHESCGTSNGTDPENLIFNNDVAILIDNDNSVYFEDYTKVYNWRTKDYENPKKSIEELFDDPPSSLTIKW